MLWVLPVQRWLFVVFIFFFQAEDGIRDTSVTGVQTCALPISTPRSLCRDKDCVEWRSQFRVFSTPAVLRARKCLVADRKEDRVGRDSIIVLDSIPERSTDCDYSLDGVPGRAHDCARARRVAYWRPAADCVHSAKRFLCDEQRRFVARLFRRVISLQLAMVASEKRKSLAWGSDRFRSSRRVPNETIESAFDRSHFSRGHCETAADCPANAAHRAGGAGCTHCLCRNPNWQLDGVDKIPIRRPNRVHSENHFARLDKKAVR